jgi:hypothetical protein
MKTSNNIICLTSAGYTSVMMAIKMQEWYPNHNIINVMANTSKERIESLEFMNECDKFFGLNLVWIESKINETKGGSTDFNITSFENLKTKGEIFEEGIKKYGIPSKINKWCNRDLKINPIKKYSDSLFGANNYSVAIGLRIDEIDRISKNYKTNNIFYPPFENSISKRERNLFWKNQPIKLSIPAYKGNCDACFEKSMRKKMTILIEEPYIFDWWNEMEIKYSEIPIEGKESYNHFACNGGHFFGRQNQSIQQLIEEAKKPFSKATDEYIYEDDLFDFEDECGSYCTFK